MKILAVDDDLVFLELLVAALGQAGYDNVVVALSAVDALQEVQRAQTPFECFLLDSNMPDWDGVELCRTIRELPQYSQTPIIMVTALSSKFSIDRAFAAGATDYITKPLDGLQLGGRIQIAATMNAANKPEREATASMQGLPYRDDARPHVMLSKRLEWTDVDNAIEFVALENYLLRLKPGIYNMWVTAYSIATEQDIHANESSEGFQRTIKEVGRAISTALDGTRFFLAYAGRGTFVTVSEGLCRSEDGPIQSAIDARIARLALTNRDLKAVMVRVISGADFCRGPPSTPASLIEDLADLGRNPQIPAQIDHLCRRMERKMPGSRTAGSARSVYNGAGFRSSGRTALVMAGDDESFRFVLRSILQDRLGFPEVVETTSSEAAIKLLRCGGDICLVLFDLNMPGMNNWQNLRAVRECFPLVRMAVVSDSRDRHDILMALSIGLHGYVYKGAGIAELVRAIGLIDEGMVYVPSFLPDLRVTGSEMAVGHETVINQIEPEIVQSMTSRQKEILRLLVDGKSNKGMARALNLSEGTIKFHIAAVFRILGASNRVEAAISGATLLQGSLRGQP